MIGGDVSGDVPENGAARRAAGEIESESPPEETTSGSDVTDSGTQSPDDAPGTGSDETSASEVTDADAVGPDDEAPADEPEVPAAELTPEQIDALVAERDEFLAAYQRSAADFENFRKQAQKRLIDEVHRAQSSFVERLLPVLDAIEAAEAHGSTDVDAIANQLFGFLEKEGLQRVHPAGEAFDPEVAEAVMHEPGEGEPTVVEVLRTGYLWNGRVIRAAMVRVAG